MIKPHPSNSDSGRPLVCLGNAYSYDEVVDLFSGYKQLLVRLLVQRCLNYESTIATLQQENANLRKMVSNLPTQ